MALLQWMESRRVAIITLESRCSELASGETISWKKDEMQPRTWEALIKSFRVFLCISCVIVYECVLNTYLFLIIAYGRLTHRNFSANSRNQISDFMLSINKFLLFYICFYEHILNERDLNRVAMVFEIFTRMQKSVGRYRYKR